MHRFRRKSRSFESFGLSSRERFEFVARFAVSRTFLAFLGIGLVCFFILPLLWSRFEHVITEPLIEQAVDAPPSELNSHVRILGVVAAGVPMVLMFGGGVVAMLFFSKRFIRRQRMILRSMGFPICTQCGYHLTGLEDDPQADKCPECGALIDDMPELGKRKAE